jgi:hypothetical protein
MCCYITLDSYFLLLIMEGLYIYVKYCATWCILPPVGGSCPHPKTDQAWCGHPTGRYRVTPSVPARCYGATSPAQSWMGLKATRGSPRGQSGPLVIESKRAWWGSETISIFLEGKIHRYDL